MTSNILILTEFLLYLIFWLLLPGALITVLLSKKTIFHSNGHKTSQNLALYSLLSFFLGMGLMILIYVAECSTGVNGLLKISGPVFSALAIILGFLSFKNNDFASKSNGNNKYYWLKNLVFFTIMLVLSYVSVTNIYLNSPNYTSLNIHHDYLFHTGNVVLLSKNLPNNDIRVLGLSFFYHYFPDLIYAMCKHIFTMRAFNLVMIGKPIVAAFTNSCAMIVLGSRIQAAINNSSCEKSNSLNRLTEKHPGFTAFICDFGLLFSCVFLGPISLRDIHFPLSAANHHILTNANAMGFAIVLTILYLEILIRIWNQKFDIRNLVLIAALTFLTTGFKGTTALVLLAAMGSCFVVEAIIEKRFSLTKLLYLVASGICFYITYVSFVTDTSHPAYNNRTTKLSFAGTAAAGRVGQVFSILGLDIQSGVICMITAILTALVVAGPLIIAVIAFLVVRVKDIVESFKVKNTTRVGNMYDWFAFAAVIIGLVGCSMFDVEGFSQGYLLFTSAGLIFYLAMMYISRGSSKLIKGLTLLCLAAGIIITIGDTANDLHTAKSVKAAGQIETKDDFNRVSHLEMEGYSWLCENTDDDCIIATDRYSEKQNRKDIFFYMSAFAERQIFLEGYSYSDISDEISDEMKTINASFYSDNAGIAKEALKKHGIDYLVVSTIENPDYIADDSILELVYGNEDMKIYKVK